jgi:hypothetical protein
MATKIERMQRFIHYYRQQTKKAEIDMHDVARLAEKMGWKLPVPPEPIDLLAKQFVDAAREETQVDKKTKRPYRANLAITRRGADGKQLGFWIETDNATRDQMVKALTLYRDQMVSEAVIGADTADHWNRTHPNQLPLPFENDLTDDVKWRRNAPDEGEKAS